jgi:Clr5 domain
MSTSSEIPYIPFLSQRVSGTTRASRLPGDQWAKHRHNIRDLYIGQEKTLEQVVEIMRKDHGFHATYALLYAHG